MVAVCCSSGRSERGRESIKSKLALPHSSGGRRRKRGMRVHLCGEARQTVTFSVYLSIYLSSGPFLPSLAPSEGDESTKLTFY